MANEYSADRASPNPRGVARIFYSTVRGDICKIRARSNVTKSGGGARDFRLGSYKKVAPILKKIFPAVKTVKRKRKGQRVNVRIRSGRFYWDSGEAETSKKGNLEPPSEARMSLVHEVLCFNPDKIPALNKKNMVLLFLVQCHDGTVWPCFIEENSLALPDAWDPWIPKTILPFIKAKRASQRTVIGYQDFVTRTWYRNGK